MKSGNTPAKPPVDYTSNHKVDHATPPVTTPQAKRITSTDAFSMSENTEPKLLKFGDESSRIKKVSAGSDINNKITTLDTDLDKLRNELQSINNSVEEGLDRLSDTDTDLTAKVSETYKRLGEIDNAYKSLLGISSRIDSDIKKLNGDIGTVAEQSASGIKNLEKITVEQSISQSKEFSQQNQQVVTRVNRLAETSKITTEMLDQKIQHTTDSILLIEKNLIAEIDALSASTNDKTKLIIDDAEQTRAKVFKLQAIDEAIIKRATMLEISSAELSVQNQELQSSTRMLLSSTENLNESLSDLSERTDELEVLSKQQAEFIDDLQKEGAELADSVVDLASRENRHFNMAGAGFVVLLIIAIGVYFMQQAQFESVNKEVVGQGSELGKQVADLEQKVVDMNASLASSVNNRIDAAGIRQAERQQSDLEQSRQQFDNKLKDLKDQVNSVDGRLSLESISNQIGDDNIIHGKQWLQALPAEHFVVQVAYVGNSGKMYELAQYYNDYLKDSLSYFEVKKGAATRYVLLSGNYPSLQQAEMALRSMPRYIEKQRPIVRDVASIQKFFE